MAGTVTVHGAPGISGLRFRQINAPEDYHNINMIFKASSEEDDKDYSETVDDISSYYSHLANCDPEKDILFVEVSGKAIGYSRVWYVVKNDVQGRMFQFFAALVPEWRGKGIREAMLSWCESRIGEMMSSMPVDSQNEIILWVMESEREWRSILEANGYETVRYGFKMIRPLSQPIPVCPLPEGIDVRPVTPDQYRKIWDADIEASKDGWLSLKAEDEWYESWVSDRLFQPELWQVAWDGDRVAGAVQNWIDTEENERFNRRWGWTENIHVGREWRGRGIAKALIARSFDVLKGRGMETAALGVDALNPTGALQLYKTMGFVENKRSFTYLKKL